MDFVIPEFQNQQVLVEGQSSENVPVVSGVPQGSVLGPVLFLIFIDDLPDDINSRTILFADDCILHRQISSENDQQLLQEDLDMLATWGKIWGMEFHPQRCSIMRISRARTPRTFQYHLKGVPLSEKQSLKYLGWVYSPTYHGKSYKLENNKVQHYARFPDTQSTTSKRRNQGTGLLHGTIQPGLLFYNLESLPT